MYMASSRCPGGNLREEPTIDMFDLATEGAFVCPFPEPVYYRGWKRLKRRFMEVCLLRKSLPALTVFVPLCSSEKL